MMIYFNLKMGLKPHQHQTEHTYIPPEPLPLRPNSGPGPYFKFFETHQNVLPKGTNEYIPKDPT